MWEPVVLLYTNSFLALRGDPNGETLKQLFEFNFKIKIQVKEKLSIHKS